MKGKMFSCQSSPDNYYPWFAWRPFMVTISTHPRTYQWVWWEWIEYKMCGEWGADWWYSYRFPGSNVHERGGVY